MGFGEADERVDGDLDSFTAGELGIAAQRPTELGAGPLEDRDHERVSVREVVVEEAPGDPRAAGYVVDRDLIGGAGAQQLDSRAQELFPARVDRKTEGIACDRSGNGEPLMVLHGTGGSRRQWDPVRPMLTAHHEVIAVDLPGHGASDPPAADGDHTPLGYAVALAAFLDELRIDTIHTAGDSVGGWTALELAKLGRARSVVAIAPAGLWLRRDPWRCSLRLWGMYRLGRITAPLADRALRSEAGRVRLLRGTVAKPLNLTQDEARDLIETYNSTPTFTKHLAQTRRARFQDGASIRVPVTVAWGDAERLIPPKARRQDELPAHTRTISLSGCGHIPFWDDPEQVARTILDTTSGGRPDGLRGPIPD